MSEITTVQIKTTLSWLCKYERIIHYALNAHLQSQLDVVFIWMVIIYCVLRFALIYCCVATDFAALVISALEFPSRFGHWYSLVSLLVRLTRALMVENWVGQEENNFSDHKLIFLRICEKQMVVGNPGAVFRIALLFRNCRNQSREDRR